MTFWPFYVLSSGTIAGDLRNIVRLVLAVANNLTIKLSRGEVFEHVQKPDSVINRKALRLAVQLVTIYKDQSWGMSMCVGWFPGQLCWDVHMQLSQCVGTQYSLPCTEWLRGLLGAGIVITGNFLKRDYKMKSLFLFKLCCFGGVKFGQKI